MQSTHALLAAIAALSTLSACSSDAGSAGATASSALSKPPCTGVVCPPPVARVPIVSGDYVDGITPTAAVVHFTADYGPTPGIVVVVDGATIASDGKSSQEAVSFTGLKPGAPHAYAIDFNGKVLASGTFATPLHVLPTPYPFPAFAQGTYAFAIDGVEGSLWVTRRNRLSGAWLGFDRLSALTGLKDVAVRSLEYMLDVAIVDSSGVVQRAGWPFGASPISFSALGMAPGVPAVPFTRVALASYVDRDPWDSPGYAAYAVGRDGAIYYGFTSNEVTRFTGFMKLPFPGAPQAFTSVAAATIPSTGEILVAGVSGGDVYVLRQTGSGSVGSVVDLAHDSGDNAAFYDVAIAANPNHIQSAWFDLFALSTDGVHHHAFFHDGSWIAGARSPSPPSPAPQGMALRVAAAEPFFHYSPGYQVSEQDLLFVPLSDHQLWLEVASFAPGSTPYATSLGVAAGDLSPVRAAAIATVDDVTMVSPPPPPPTPPPPPVVPPPPQTCPPGETLTTYVLCESCPAGITGEPDHTSTWIVPACSHEAAQQYVEGKGNCEVDDDACPCDPAVAVCL